MRGYNRNSLIERTNKFAGYMFPLQALKKLDRRLIEQVGFSTKFPYTLGRLFFCTKVEVSLFGSMKKKNEIMPISKGTKRHQDSS